MSVATAKQLIKSILKEGGVTYSIPHSIERMEQRNISAQDCEMTLKSGIIKEEGADKYLAVTKHITVSFKFLSVSELKVITVWRNN